jgi:hypothetical protein
MSLPHSRLGGPRSPLGGPDPARAILALAVAVLLAGGFLVLRPFEDAIRSAGERERTASLRANAEEAALTQRVRIARTAARIRAGLHGLSLDAEPGAELTELLAGVQRLAEQNAVRVISIRPESTADAAPNPPSTPPLEAGGRRGSAGPIPASPLDRALPEDAGTVELRLRGGFAQTVSVIRGLSLLPTPARVLDLRLERHEAPAPAAATVDATIRFAAIRFSAARTPTL